jgi:hypothetical protein
MTDMISFRPSGLWGESSKAYFRVDTMLRELANANLRDIPTQLHFRVGLWDHSNQHIWWVDRSLVKRSDRTLPATRR